MSEPARAPEPYYKVGTWCLLLDNDKILMMQRTKEPHLGLWIPPGGKVEIGECPIECVIRETQVETGLIIAKPELRGILTEHSVYGFNWINLIFVPKSFSGTVQREMREGRMAWIALKDYHNLPTPEVDKRIIPKIFHMTKLYIGKVTYDENLHILTYKEEV